MNVDQLFIVVLVFVIAFFLGRQDRRRKQQRQRILITEPMIKINFNPSTGKWEWSRLNPKTRTWEWLAVEATNDEIEKYTGKMFSEKEGYNILYGRLGEEKNNNG